MGIHEQPFEVKIKLWKEYPSQKKVTPISKQVHPENKLTLSNIIILGGVRLADLHDRITHFVVVTMFMSCLIPQRQKRGNKIVEWENYRKNSFNLITE